jgi:hypothetical protein
MALADLSDIRRPLSKRHSSAPAIAKPDALGNQAAIIAIAAKIMKLLGNIADLTPG